MSLQLNKTKQFIDAAKILKEKEISFLVIMQDEKPIGVVSERDIVRKIAAEDKIASSSFN